VSVAFTNFASESASKEAPFFCKKSLSARLKSAVAYNRQIQKYKKNNSTIKHKKKLELNLMRV
jgi:hypothetical protein